ncbi:hypothetical protein P7K49_006040, partial [Saguinus oedipus]
ESGDNGLFEGGAGLRTPSAQEHKQTEGCLCWGQKRLAHSSRAAMDAVCPWGPVTFPLVATSGPSVPAVRGRGVSGPIGALLFLSQSSLECLWVPTVTMVLHPRTGGLRKFFPLRRTH